MSKRLVYQNIITDNTYGWDFENNISIDVLEENNKSQKIANWICHNCGTKYQDKIEGHNRFHCPTCGQREGYKVLSTNYKRKHFIYSVKSSILPAIISLFLSMIQLGFEPITKELIVILFFNFILFFEIFSIFENIYKINLNKDEDVILKRYTQYSLIEKSISEKDLKFYFYLSIENRILSLIRADHITKEDIIKMIKTEPIKNYINFVNKKERTEFKALIKIYSKKSYFIKIFSEYKTKKIIDFSNDTNITNIIINSILAIAAMLLSIYQYLNTMELLLKKALFTIPIMLIIIAAFVCFYKCKKKDIIGKYVHDNIYLSSAIAKQNTNSTIS